MADTQGHLSIRKASKRLGLSRPTVSNMIKRGTFHVSEGEDGAKLIPAAEIDAYIAEHGVKAKPAEPEGLFGLGGDGQSAPAASETPGPASPDLMGILQEIRGHVAEISQEIAALRRGQLAGLVASANGADANPVEREEPHRTPLGSRW